ncbi:uncharacterized protein ACNLHF_024255 isoform 2-T2 [Anomaloglossus baeobatrachus]|uniref:uncharacterized protein LOC142316897 isoform X2 n=1 Tax=Anomaloglossus baeobatrachus TaxID=238106 RepID=UPI003F4F6446
MRPTRKVREGHGKEKPSIKMKYEKVALLLNQEEMDSYKNWNKETKDFEGKMTSSLLEKEHFPKLKTSFYVMGSTFLLLCFISVIVYMLHQGTITNDVNERTREI